MASAGEIRTKAEARDRLRVDVRTDQARNDDRNRIIGLLVRVSEWAHQIVGLREQRELTEARHANWHSLHPTFSEPSETPSSLMTASLFLLLVYPAAYCLDVYLLSGNA